MRLLVTNDDGIESVGIHALAVALADAGHEPVVVAPDRDWSGASSALGSMHPDEHIDCTKVEVPGAPRIEAYSLAGPPALAVLSARLGAFGAQPDAVVSGINAGANTGRAILHSGTVGAVLTAQNFGLSGLAVSVQSSDPWHWDTAATMACDVLDRLLAAAPARSALNLNVPARPRAEVKGVRWARLAPFGEVRAAVADPAADGRLQFVLEATEHDFDDDTDQGLLRDGWAALTTLVGVVEAWPAEEGYDPDEEIDVVERVVPGASLHDVHRVPDAMDSRTLQRSRPSPNDGVIGT
jgi:5'-nucleotidase